MDSRVVGYVFLAGWLAFGAYWLISAFASHSRHRWSPRSAGLRAVIVVLILLGFRLRILRGHAIAVHNTALQVVGLTLFIAGVGLAVWARIHLGRNWGMPMTKAADPDLVTNGPYRYVRHPIYTGFIAAMAGTALALSLYGLVIVAIMSAYFVYSATVEERTLTAQFPEEYPVYRASTKMLVPFVI